jgi:hypothetical protein
MGRGQREGGHRGGEGYQGQSVRGSYDERWDLVDPEHDPLRELRDEEEDFPYRASDEYIWPGPEEAEDD